MIVVALSTFTIAVDGIPLTVREGEAWAADDPVVKRYPESFSKDGRTVRRSVPVVEQATAAPGERRAR